VGGKLEDTKLVYGIVLDKDFSHPQMPKVKSSSLINACHSLSYRRASAMSTLSYCAVQIGPTVSYWFHYTASPMVQRSPGVPWRICPLFFGG
jgi:hypothetical protein